MPVIRTPRPARRRGVVRRRVILGASMLTLAVTSAFGTRLLLSLASLTHQNPLSALADVLHGKGDSSIQHKIDAGQRINIALYGYGGPGHDGPYLTDSILLVSLQPRKDGPPGVAEISVPRDWYVPIDLGRGRTDHARINQAFQDGADGAGGALPATPGSGAQIANATLARVLGIHIDNYLGVDFTAFKDGVDAVGGVDIDVPTTFTDHQYPHGECGPNGDGDCRYETVHFDAGHQHMDGSTALIYARSRHSTDPGEGTDFARSRRQQLVLQALKSRVVSIGGIGHLPDLLSALASHISTDLGIGDGQALYDLVKDVDRSSIHRVSLDNTNFLYDCGYPQDCSAAYLYAHDASFASIGRFVQQALPDPAVLNEHAPVGLEDASGNGGGPSGRWAALLGSLGFIAHDAGAVQRAATTQVIDQSGGRHSATAAWLGRYFGVTPQTAGSPPPQGAADPGVTVVLGQDEERAFTAVPQSSSSGGGSDGPGQGSESTGQRSGESGSSSSSRRRANATPRPVEETSAPTPEPAQPTSPTNAGGSVPSLPPWIFGTPRPVP